MLDAALIFARDNKQTLLDSLCAWLRIPSISTSPEHRPHVRQAAEWIAKYLKTIGIENVLIQDTAGHPLVTANWLHAKNKPTLLIYGHFDVQPTDPDELWKRPPFEPTLDNENLFARGASDDKGQTFAVIAALESYLKTSATLPINVKILLEGEEEITSPNLFQFIRTHANELQADAILIADQDMLDKEHPTILWGLRGILYVEIEISGPMRDLHSGTFGGSVDNPLNVLARLLAKLQDETSRKILIPNFYKDVEELSDEERNLIAQAPINDEIGLHLTGAPKLAGEENYSLAERISSRPTLEIHGIAGGFTSDGSKTIIPAKATAKVSMRLVPKQNPQEVFESLKNYLQAHCPPTVQLNVKKIGAAKAVKIDYKTPAIQAAATAYEKGFGHKPIYLRGGGSLPIVDEMIKNLSIAPHQPIPVAMIGFGLPDDNAHAPNEKIHVPNFHQGIETVIHFLDLFSKT